MECNDGLKERIVEMVERDRLYLSPEFNCAFLCTYAGLDGRTSLDRLFFSVYGDSCSNVINVARLVFARNLMSKYGLSAEDAAKMSGFSSKKSFERALGLLNY